MEIDSLNVKIIISIKPNINWNINMYVKSHESMEMLPSSYYSWKCLVNEMFIDGSVRQKCIKNGRWRWFLIIISSFYRPASYNAYVVSNSNLGNWLDAHIFRWHCIIEDFSELSRLAFSVEFLPAMVKYKPSIEIAKINILIKIFVLSYLW